MDNPIEPVGEVLILAGDIIPFSVMDKRKEFFDYLSGHFATTYWVAGNHEYYDYDISKRSGTMNEKIRDNVFLVNNNVIVKGSARIIFSTLWSKVNPVNEWRIENNINDFRVIRFQGERFTVNAFNKLHLECLNFISSELNKEWTGETIVVTHHVPTFMNYPEKYKGDILNEVFAVELQPLIERTSPDYWIYGHNHSNIPAFAIGHTEMLTNQLGYVHHNEHHLFMTDQHIVV